MAVAAAGVLSAAVAGVVVLTDTDDSDTNAADTSTAEGTELPNHSDLDCATSESTPEDSLSSADPGADGSPSLSEWIALARDPPTGEGPTAEELSTGPRLRWTEIAAGPQETLGLEPRLRLEGTSVGGV
ncbi:MAG: hypothetical protein F4Z26_05490, partial [Acidimicrobiaceae bacterium]|nr:hypothetical protein [Acidimicrobiaceae bacterium]